MELLEDTVPRHGVIEASLVADMFFLQDPLVISANGDAGTKLLGKTSRELLVGTDLDTRDHRLGVRRLGLLPRHLENDCCAWLAFFSTASFSSRPLLFAASVRFEKRKTPAIAKVVKQRLSRNLRPTTVGRKSRQTDAEGGLTERRNEKYCGFREVDRSQDDCAA